MNAIPIVNLYLTIWIRYVFLGTKTSRYGPYGLGYRYAIKTFTKWCKTNLFQFGFLLIFKFLEDKISRDKWLTLSHFYDFKVFKGQANH
jgi:hypothetical protein